MEFARGKPLPRPPPGAEGSPSRTTLRTMEQKILELGPKRKGKNTENYTAKKRTEFPPTHIIRISNGGGYGAPSGVGGTITIVIVIVINIISIVPERLAHSTKQAPNGLRGVA